MKRDTLIEMARAAQKERFDVDSGHWFKMEVRDLERFAAMIRYDEREACAEIAGHIARNHPYPSHGNAAAVVIADAIRGRTK